MFLLARFSYSNLLGEEGGGSISRIGWGKVWTRMEVGGVY